MPMPFFGGLCRLEGPRPSGLGHAPPWAGGDPTWMHAGDHVCVFLEDGVVGCSIGRSCSNRWWLSGGMVAARVVKTII